MSEEWRPCPFCGEKPEINTYEDPDGAEDTTIFCRCFSREPIADYKWNSAYCWKRIEQLLKETEIMREALEEIKNHAGGDCSYSGDIAKEALARCTKEE